MLARWLWVLLAGILAQGLGSLAFRLAPELPAITPLVVRGTFGIDIWHAWIHIAWGAAGLALLALTGRRHVATLALVFGVFYTALGVAGVTTHHPLGLELDAIENAFHLTAGPITLILGVLASIRPGGERAIRRFG